MDETPARTDDIRAQHIADLRDALQHAVRLLHFHAGREATSSPEQSDRLVSAADGMTNILNRTGPLSARPAGDQGMEGAQIWRQLEDQGERELLITRGEARAVLPLLQHLAEQRGPLADVADELVTRIGCRLPAG